MMDSRLLHFYLAIHFLLVLLLCGLSDSLGPTLVTYFDTPSSAILSDPRILMAAALLFLSAGFMILAIVTMRYFPPTSSLFQQNFSLETILAVGSPILGHALSSDSITSRLSLVYLILFIFALLFYSLIVERMFMALIISDSSQPQCDFSNLYHNIALRDALLSLSRLIAGIQQLVVYIQQFVVYTSRLVADVVIDGLGWMQRFLRLWHIVWEDMGMLVVKTGTSLFNEST
ncbi:hypothetical protein K435DRAFT_870897 [Dendrothele bispora CBS 962.96]|uniref:Uncharacterized protein n=1 Tax=Dendrothele bispora (strain CBS 962.96) TaxID=1314807 RepID=A0A4S8L5G0_DENBC|nr:hypothetical protein K435DRAFT_870897 [Dendrothele bispora CBS 962.96]